MNSRGRSLPGWGWNTMDSEFRGDQRKRINAIGAVGEGELGTLSPKLEGALDAVKICDRDLRGKEE